MRCQGSDLLRVLAFYSSVMMNPQIKPDNTIEPYWPGGPGYRDHPEEKLYHDDVYQAIPYINKPINQ
jgi:hypothetical protein